MQPRAGAGLTSIMVVLTVTLRPALGLGCLGAIRGGAGLVFPDTGDDAGPSEAPGRSPDGGRGTRV
ncbi:hypothetical protein [Streptomyces akebiae]|uniref:Uncharacterized protein n=1 Tax=Streptomyces akebiae TaxID=2865673 RepID=A0ABX8XQ74_9ACTN|nr:hypothetical protein [Streptomyces akebiae]QYX78061.1 hypothetical protein K1J60_17270 [Streptomyces akebiae]